MNKKIKNFRLLTSSAFVILITMMVSMNSFSQTNTEEIDFYQSIFGMSKKQAVAEFLQLENDDAFWLIYDAYEIDRKKLGKKRIALLNDYANNYLSLTDEKTDELVKQTISQNKQLNNLISSYYKKLKKTSGSKVAAQFYQIENYILSATRMQVMDSIPFIGEMDD